MNVVEQRDARLKSVLMGGSLRAEIESALPSHIPVERFQRVLMTSVIHDSRLVTVDPLKIVKAALKVAPLGLLTDPLLGEAYLIVDGTGQVQVRIGYRGLIKLAQQSDRIASIYAHEVCEHDEIECVLGTEKRLVHKPVLFGPRGKAIGYYAVVRYKGGETDFEPMNIEQIDVIRDRSDGWKAFQARRIKDTPWHSSYDEMAKKTALRRLLKRVPASADLQDALRHEAGLDEREYGNTEPVDVTPRRTRPAIVAGSSRLDQFVALSRPEAHEEPAAGQHDAPDEPDAEPDPTHDEDGVIEDLDQGQHPEPEPAESDPTPPVAGPAQPVEIRLPGRPKPIACGSLAAAAQTLEIECRAKAGDQPWWRQLQRINAELLNANQPLAKALAVHFPQPEG